MLGREETANLGLATTRELIREIRARWEVAHYTDSETWQLRVIDDVEGLFERDGSLDYRTVDAH